MQIFYSSKANDQLASLSSQDQIRIATKMRFYAILPDPMRYSKYIAIRKAFRFRIGDYRIFFHIKDSTIFIRTIERRDKAYMI